MSSDHARRDPPEQRGEAGGKSAAGARRTAIDRLDRVNGAQFVAGTALLAAIAVAVAAALQMLANQPLEPVALSPEVQMLARIGPPVLVGLCLVAIGATAEAPAVRVGLLFAGVFAPMAAVDTAASLPGGAAVAVGGGAGLVAAARHTDTPRAAGRSLHAAWIAGAIAATLAASTAIIDGGYRPTAGALCLLGIAAFAMHAWPDLVAVLAGALAGVGVLAAASATPFAVGGTLIAVFAATGVPVLLVALAVAGGVAIGVAGARVRSPTVVAGAVLLLFAGVPATAPRAATILLGATLVLGAGHRSIPGLTRSPQSAQAAMEVTT